MMCNPSFLDWTIDNQPQNVVKGFFRQKNLNINFGAKKVNQGIDLFLAPKCKN